MKREEVEAILKIEGSDLILRVKPFLYRGKVKRIYEEYWHAQIGVLSPEDEFIYLANAQGDTNHKAATNALKEFFRYQKQYANN